MLRYVFLFLCGFTTPLHAADTLHVAFRATVPDTQSITSRLWVAKDGAVWFGRRDGAIRYDGTNWIRYNAQDGLIDGPITTILQDRDNNFWFGGSHQGQAAICQFDGKHWRIFTVPDSIMQTPISEGGCFDTEGHLWLRPTNTIATGIGTQNHGILRFDGQAWRQFTQADGLAHNRTYDIQADPISGIWVATKEGISRYDGKTWQTLNPTHHDVKIYRLLQSQKGQWWATLGNSAGIAVFDGKTWQTYSKADGLPIDELRAMHQTPDGTMWFGTHPDDKQTGLLAFKNGMWKTLPQPEHAHHILQTKDLAGSQSGTLYFITPQLGFLEYHPILDWSTNAIAPQPNLQKSFFLEALFVLLLPIVCLFYFYKRKTLLWHLLWRPSQTFQTAIHNRDWSGPLLIILICVGLFCLPLFGNWTTTLLKTHSFVANIFPFFVLIFLIFLIYTTICMFRAGLIWTLARLLKHDVLFTQLFAVVGYAYAIEMFAILMISWGYALSGAELPNGISALTLFSLERPTSLGWIVSQFETFTTSNKILEFLYQIELFGLWSLTLTIIGVRTLYPFNTQRAVAISLSYWIILNLMWIGSKETSFLFIMIVVASAIFIPLLILKQHRRLKAVEAQLVQEMENELQTAHDMQMRLMPETLPQIQGYDIAGTCVPANHVGGDFYQCYQQNDTLRLALADVTGHAMEAAIPVVMFSGILDAHMQRSQPVDELFGELNQSLYRNLDTRTFVCFAMAELNIPSQTLHISNGGCPYPYHYHATTNTLTEIELDAYPLGVRPETVYEIQKTQLQSGDYLIFCSDGIAEAENQLGEQIGFDAISQIILEACQQQLSAQHIINHILDQVQQFMNEANQSDDMTCIVLRGT